MPTLQENQDRLAKLKRLKSLRQQRDSLVSQPQTQTGIEPLPPVTPQTVQPLPSITDPSPGLGASGFPQPLRAGVQPAGPGGLAELVSQGFSAAGFDPTTDEQVAAQGLPGEGGLARGLGTTGQVLSNIVKGGIRGPVEFGAGLADALAQTIGTGSLEPALAQARELVEFIPGQVETVGTALGAKRVDPRGEITGISQRTGLAVRRGIAPTEEEVGGARRELRERPEGPIFAALLGRGVGKKIAKEARPKPLLKKTPETLISEPVIKEPLVEPPTPEQKAVGEFFETQPKPSVTLPEKPAKKIAKVTEAPKVELKKPVTPLPKPKVAAKPVPKLEIPADKRIEAVGKETKSPSVKALKPEAFEDLGDFAVLGADKLATARKAKFKKGERPPPDDFNQFSQDMVADFGENIRPHLEQVFDESVRVKETVAKELLTKSRPRPTQATVNEIKKTFTEFVDRTPATFKSSGKIDLKRRAKKEGVKIEEAEPTLDGQKISTFKDIGNIQANFNTFPRIMRRVLGKERADRMFVDQFDNAKGAMTDMSLKLLNDMESTVTAPTKKGGLGIKEGSKESKAVQEFGEQNRNFDSLVKEFGDEKARNIVKATAWFRGKYDLLLDEINATMEVVYPGRVDKLIPKRRDYFRHFRELSEGVRAIPELFQTPSEISPSLAGVSETTRPLMRFLSIAQRRIGGKSRIDAVEGFKNYIPQASYTKHISPQIKNLRNFASELRAASQKHVDQTGSKPTLNRYIQYVDQFANQLAGKTGALDRVIIDQIPGGRTGLRAIDWVSRRVAQNAILGNVGSLVAMPANIANAAGKLKLDLARGATRSMVDIFDKRSPIRKSDFWKERDLQESFNRFNAGWMRHPVRNSSRFAGWAISVADKVAGYPIWNAGYRKALEQGIKNPSRFADNLSRDLLAGRGVGDRPLAFTAKSSKIFLQFQLEVTNAWYVLKDLVSEKDFAGLAIAMVAAWSYNRFAEEVRGNKVVFDPIDAILDGVDTFNDPESDEGTGTKLLRAGGRVAGEFLSNIPLGQVAGGAYPRQGIEGLPTRKELFGAEDPTRFGTGVLIEKAISDPLFSLLPPFGGQQIKKTVGGVKANIEGEVRSKSGKTKLFDVPSDAETRIKNVLFGKWSTATAREFFDKRSPRKSDVSTGTRRKRPTRERPSRQR